MGKYTTYNESWIDRAIDSHLDVMIQKIKSNLPQVLSIFVVGGFGRGEGSVRLEDNHKVVPINDYDIYLVVEKGIKEETINNLAKDIEKELGSKGYSLYGHSEKEFYFDIRSMAKSKLEKLPPMIKYYELKHSSMLICGRDLRDLIPDFNKNDLIFSDGIRFLLNRISHITEWFSANYIKNEPVEDWERETLIYDISKTYIECCTILTLLKGYYQPTYQGRLQQLLAHKDEFEELWQKFPDLLDKIEYFTRQKLQPNFKEIRNVKDVWLEARKHTLGVLEFILIKKYKAKTWQDFKDVARRNYLKAYLRTLLCSKLPEFSYPFFNFFIHIGLNMIWFSRLIKFKKVVYWPLLYNLTDPGIMIFYASLFMVQTIKKDGSIDKELMSGSIKILKSIYPLKEIDYNLDGYDELRKIFSDIWRLYYFQKLV